jgi:hypothetical protein
MISSINELSSEEILRFEPLDSVELVKERYGFMEVYDLYKIRLKIVEQWNQSLQKYLIKLLFED